MIKTELFNNVPASMASQVKRGQKVVFRILNISPDPLNPGHLRMPSVVMIPPTDRVFSEETGDYVDIAAIRGVAAGGKITFYDIDFTSAERGHKILDTSTREGLDIAQYLYISNYNASNKHRDASLPALFELVDETGKAKEKLNIRKIRRDALIAASGLSDDDVKMVVSAMGGDENRPIEVLRDEVETYAETNPDEFLKLSASKHNHIKAVAKRAMDAKLIQFNRQQSRIEWVSTGDPILTVPRSSSRRPLDAFLSFVMENKNGSSVLEEIENLLAK
jgi:hypothetical protein